MGRCDEDSCCFPRCRHPSDKIYIGREICDNHWAQLCEASSKTEKGMLKRIGLVRNDSGVVGPITIEGKD